MNSFVGDRERRLIFELVQGRTSEYQFLLEYPVPRAEASRLSLGMLTIALQERDGTDVEFGLFLAFKFGVSIEHVAVLCALAEEDWHESHEDVVEALSKIREPKSVDVL
jgi:hypothetical protein